MTAKDTADRAAEAIDFTMVHATHDAYRRDLAASPRHRPPGRLTSPGSVRLGESQGSVAAGPQRGG
jgi:hypothetical protein